MLRLLLVLIGCCILAPEGQGGILIAPSVHWRTFSFDEGENPITPNYYGVGGAIAMGYSVARTVDIALYGDYTPATLTNLEVGKSDAMLTSYGVQFGARIMESVFVAARSGNQLYNVLTRRKPEDEIDGRWTGVFFGASLGAMFLTAKQTCWQISLDANRAEMERVDQRGFSARKLDSFSVSLSFVFNSRPSGSNFLGGFIRSVGY